MEKGTKHCFVPFVFLFIAMTSDAFRLSYLAQQQKRDNADQDQHEHREGN